MKKQILFSRTDHLSKGGFALADIINKHEPIYLQGYFMPHVNFWELAALAPVDSVVTAPFFISEPNLSAETIAQSREGIFQFKTQCQAKTISSVISERPSNYVLEVVQNESRFADLMIFNSDSLDQNTDFAGFDEVRADSIHQAECPVAIVPDSFSVIEEVIIAYDGSPSSIYALKEFAEMFPYFAKLPTTIVFTTENETQTIPNKEHIHQMGLRLYPNAEFKVLVVDDKTTFRDWLSYKKNPIVILGAFGRSFFSNLFKSSFAGEILKYPQFPLFIAHK